MPAIDDDCALAQAATDGTDLDRSVKFRRVRTAINSRPTVVDVKPAKHARAAGLALAGGPAAARGRPSLALSGRPGARRQPGAARSRPGRRGGAAR
jgi:hypothetical protein